MFPFPPFPLGGAAAARLTCFCAPRPSETHTEMCGSAFPFLGCHGKSRHTLMLGSALRARALCLFGAPSQDNHRAFSDCQFNDDIKDRMRSSLNVTCQTIGEPLRAELRAGSTSAKTPCNTGLMLSQTLPRGKNWLTRARKPTFLPSKSGDCP